MPLEEIDFMIVFIVLNIKIYGEKSTIKIPNNRISGLIGSVNQTEIYFEGCYL